MKKWLNIFIYISILFLIYALWKADYLIIPDVQSYFWLIISVLFLFGGFITKSLVWTKGLGSEKIDVSLKDGIASTGLAELGKYIPGKLWVLMGRAVYISNFYPISLIRASAISLNVQMLTVWSGSLAGLIGMFFINVPISWGIAMLAGWIVLSMVLFVRHIHDWFHKILEKLTKKEVAVPFIDIRERKEILFWLFFDWLIRMAAFYFLILSLTDGYSSFAVSFGFPLAITIGILAIIVPGGIGVREGILGIWLVNAGFELEMATSIAVVSRLWSLLGEIGVFSLGMLIKFTRKK